MKTPAAVRQGCFEIRLRALSFCASASPYLCSVRRAAACAAKPGAGKGNTVAFSDPPFESLHLRLHHKKHRSKSGVMIVGWLLVQGDSFSAIGRPCLHSMLRTSRLGPKTRPLKSMHCIDFALWARGFESLHQGSTTKNTTQRVVFFVVEIRGLEPLTSALRTQRSTN